MDAGPKSVKRDDMMETLGSLCDKLTIVKLKQYHSQDLKRLDSLATQEIQLCEEIDNYINNAISGKIPHDRLIFSSNKIYRSEGNEINTITGSVSKIFSELARVNCCLWHEQEKVYEFENVPPSEKDNVVKQLALLNLQRTQCIDEIDITLQKMIVDYH